MNYLGPQKKSSIEDHKHRMTAEALKIKAQDDTRGLKAINNSPTANYWSKETNLENWAKTVSGITEQRTNIQRM